MARTPVAATNTSALDQGDDDIPGNVPESEQAVTASAEDPVDLVHTHPEKPTGNLHKDAAIATIQQQHTIPSTGKRRPTSRWEYIFFCTFYFTAPIGGNGASLRQALLSQAYPSGYINWGGRDMVLNSMLLDVSGIQFAAQLILLLTIGPYADYGNWRPWIMIVFQVIVYICQFAMCGISRPDQWAAAMTLYVLGSIASNVVGAFYSATFPGLVRDLPSLIRSEQEVLVGIKSPEEHAKQDSYERSKLFNLVNITGSALVVITSAISVGISVAIGYATESQLIWSYRVLMAFLGSVFLLCTLPFFIVQKHRPGQQLPEGTKFWLVGIKQVWSAARSSRRLKNCLLYLFAYFMFQETSGTYFAVTSILMNEVVNYSPEILNAMLLVADLAGGFGTVFILLMQRRFGFSIKSAVMYGAAMAIIANVWGGIGTWTDTVGFHQVWHFWLYEAWNFQTAAWGSYSVTMISEVVPAPKAYMFFALFSTVGKTSSFIGPFVTSAIIERADGNTSVAYWFLVAMGCVGWIALYFVDTDEAKRDNEHYLQREADELYTDAQRAQSEQMEMDDLKR